MEDKKRTRCALRKPLGVPAACAVAAPRCASAEKGQDLRLRRPRWAGARQAWCPGVAGASFFKKRARTAGFLPESGCAARRPAAQGRTRQQEAKRSDQPRGVLRWEAATTWRAGMCSPPGFSRG